MKTASPPARKGQIASKNAQTPRVWGLDPRQLHDLLWAARGMQVVRPGQPPDPRGPGVFLLLMPTQAVLAHAQPWLKRLTWLACPLLRVRVVDRRGVSYRERVITDDQQRFRRIARVYPKHEGDAHRVAVTTDPSIARQWASLHPELATWAALAGGKKWTRGAVMGSEGRLFDHSRDESASELLRALVAEWREPSRVIPGIYLWKTGVWVHESARLDPSAKIVGPAWIGAETNVSTGRPVVGPMILPDTRELDAQVQVDWESLRLPSFPLLPRVRGGLSRRVSKRIFDIVMSLCILAGTLPLYPFIMLAIYLEDGRPFFFAHKRQTLAGKDFPCWKFRTMIKDAEKLKAQLQAQNVCDGPQFFIARDPRLLRCGWWLRRLQFDELPQFWNVLLGHMSVVGPRPSPDKENQFCPAWREARLSVRPGITGLWQVRRTRMPETDFQEWIRYDLEYVQHHSWRMDIWIILQTFIKIVRG